MSLDYETLVYARGLRAKGRSWQATSDATGVSIHDLRMGLDPDYKCAQTGCSVSLAAIVREARASPAPRPHHVKAGGRRKSSGVMVGTLQLAVIRLIASGLVDVGSMATSLLASGHGDGLVTHKRVCSSVGVVLAALSERGLVSREPNPDAGYRKPMWLYALTAAGVVVVEERAAA